MSSAISLLKKACNDSRAFSFNMSILLAATKMGLSGTSLRNRGSQKEWQRSFMESLSAATSSTMTSATVIMSCTVTLSSS